MAGVAGVGTALAATAIATVAPGTHERPLALVYNGPQGCDDCAPAIAEVLRDPRHGFRVEYVGTGTGKPLDRAALDGATLYVQPGGGDDLDATWADLEPVAADVRDWVARGGAYLGLCFGAYLAASDPGFGILPGDSFGWAGSDGASVADGRDTVIPIDWRGTVRHMYFQDGPGFVLRADADAEVIGRYPNGVPAALVARYGKGVVGVTGPHPEATEAWYTDKGLTNPDGYSLDLADDLISTVLARA